MMNLFQTTYHKVPAMILKKTITIQVQKKCMLPKHLKDFELFLIEDNTPLTYFEALKSKDTEK